MILLELEIIALLLHDLPEQELWWAEEAGPEESREQW